MKRYSEASFQLDNDDAKSQSDFAFKLNGGVDAWKSSKQATTNIFHHRAEYIIVSQATKEVVWMKNYIQKLGVLPSIAEPVIISTITTRRLHKQMNRDLIIIPNILLDATICLQRW
ncbi:UNVERIFIED_CONTAM: Retrovirus-related Pol polyprotein from transposon TNT 1-94 [Sesamum angustifolium]|uniref:Retrovirus-related Pol polyprotein from transposon TNT 1-94 n=1 Tax=Sesamum angustifolium TaxID=2727405 RepID=A0AAW2IKZ4_9LAMI